MEEKIQGEKVSKWSGGGTYRTLEDVVSTSQKRKPRKKKPTKSLTAEVKY